MNIKNKKTNKIISLLLVFCMIFSMIPNIFANSNEFEQRSNPEDRTYISFDDVSIEKIWDDKGYEDKRPSEIDLIIYGTDTYDADKSLWTEIETITLDKEYDEVDNYTWCYTSSLYLPYYEYYYLAEANQGNYYTEPVMLTSMVESAPMSLRNEYDVAPAVMMVNEMFGSITNKYIDPSEPVQFLINKVWEDDNNKNETRPEFIEVELYGTNTEGAVSGGELLETITLTSSQHTVVGNKNKWQTVSPIIKTEYKYFYLKEITNNENYTISISPINKIDSLNISSVINSQQTRDLRPEGTPRLTLNKIWANELTEDTRERISVDIYGSNNDDLSNATYIDSIYLFKGALEINLYDDENSPYFSDNYKYYFFEEDIDTLSVNGGYYVKTGSSHKFREITVEDSEGNQKNIFATTSTITNTFFEELPIYYEATITNEFIKSPRDVQFQIKKIWEDEFNKYKARGPVTVNIFGTDTYGATTGGEQIGSFVITEADATTGRVWEKTSPVFSTSYKYFYVEEQLPESSRYITRIEPLEKVEPEVEFPEGYVMERPSTYAWQPPEEFSINIYKTWDDNDNAAGKRPEFIDFKIYYSESDVSVDEMSLYAKVRLYEDNVEILEDPLNRFNYDNIYTEEWTTCIESNVYEDKDWFYYVEEVPVINYATAINQELYFEGDTYGWETHVANVYCPETYKTTIVNIYDKPRTVQFEIVKTWNDNNDKYHLRPTFIDVEIYGVETEGATTGGELIETVRLTYNNKIDSNTWKKRITELETDYEYFYVKEINGSSSYTATISPVKKVTSFTTIVNNLQNNSGIAPLAGFEDFIYLNKIWDDNNNEKGKRPESIIINAYTDEAKTDLYFSLELTETTCTMLEDPYGLDLYGDGGWTAEGIFFSGAPDVPELYIEEVCDNYVSSAVVTIEESEEMMGTDTTITITNTYVENPPELYEVNVTNTVIPPERDVQFKINKIWDDQDNRFNERGPISIEVFGTNTEGATTNGTSLGSFTITESDSTGTNTWSKTSPVYSTNFKYFYIVETFNNASYTSTISPLTKLDPPDPVEPYSTEERESISLYAGMIQSYSIYVQKNWEDNDNAAGKRPEFVDINIYHYESEESYENKDLYCSLRLYEDDYEILDNPSGTITPGYGGEWSATLYAPFSDSESDYWVEEVPNPNYVSFEMYIPGMDRYDRVSWADITNTYYVETYEATITNTYAPPTEVIFNITKTWDDNNNAANLRPLDIQVKIYGTNTEGATTGGTLIDTVVLTNEDVSSTNANVWNKTVVLDADYDYFYVVELSSLGTELNTYTLTNNTVTEVNNTVQPSNEDDDSISLFSGLTNKKFSITKIWNDNDNALGLRPEEIILSVYYNDTDNESGKKLLCKAKLTATTFEIIEKDDSYIKDDINVRYKDDWCFSMRLNKSCPYYIWVEEENTSYYDMSYDTFYDLVDNLDVTVTNTLKELRTYNINLTNKLDSLPIKVTKIWRDEDNRYDTRPDSLDITVYQNGTVFEVITFTSANMIGGNINVWESTINVPKFDENGNEYIYTISEDENNLELGYYYYEPSINQSSLTATNVGVWLPPIDIDVTPEYSIIVGKEIIDENDEIATAEDFWKLKLNIDDTYEFPIVLKELEKVLSKGNTSMEEEYEGYTGNVIHGVLTNKGQLLFTNIKPGKYEISEIINQYFDFVGMEKIESTEGASLTYEDGKYYITLSGVTKDSESITVKVINRLEDERPFNDVGIKNNLFVIPERENIDHDQPQD